MIFGAELKYVVTEEDQTWRLQGMFETYVSPEINANCSLDECEKYPTNRMKKHF